MDASADWIDLSHPISPDVAKVPFLPRPTFESIEDASLQATELSIATHVGTHLEAPSHLREGGTTIDEYPVSKFISRGIVADTDVDSLERIDLEDLVLPADPQPGDALLVRTGWAEYVGDDRYYEQPYFSDDLAEWMVEADLSWVGIDSPSPEMPVQLRAESFAYPVHSSLLDNDILIAEHLRNLAAVSGQVVDVIALPLALVGADGAQARIVARRRG